MTFCSVINERSHEDNLKIGLKNLDGLIKDASKYLNNYKHGNTSLDELEIGWDIRKQAERIEANFQVLQKRAEKEM